jgi:hypothetical protein
VHARVVWLLALVPVLSLASWQGNLLPTLGFVIAVILLGRYMRKDMLQKSVSIDTKDLPEHLQSLYADIDYRCLRVNKLFAISFLFPAAAHQVTFVAQHSAPSFKVAATCVY